MRASDFHPYDPAKAEIGRLLFYDPILSGNRNISCGTCHHHDLGSADGLPLGIGEGGIGLGPDRVAGDIRKRIPRNASGLWNLGAREFTVLFHDGRLSVSDDFDNEFNTPAEEWLPDGLTTPLAAQVIFPLASRFEMAGDPGENSVAGAIQDRIDSGWPILAKRVRAIPQYGAMFTAAFDDINAPEHTTIAHIGVALGDFINAEWRSFDSPFDRFIAGDDAALTPAQRRGMDLFYGDAGCAQCHGGKFLTDHDFHALGLPQFGPGRNRRFDPYARDVGRMGESDRLEDAYRFRTPSLRNVALTAPYGHNGAYRTLEGVVRHHLDPVAGLAEWTESDVDLPDAPAVSATDFIVLQDRRERARLAKALDIAPQIRTDAEIADLVAFLHGLTGADSIYGRLGRPETVPSGLKVE